MFNIGGSELLVILFVALIFLGPERLPTAAKQVGKTIATLRGMAQGFQREFEDAVTIAEDSAREEEARARGAELVAASAAETDAGVTSAADEAAKTADSEAGTSDPAGTPDAVDAAEGAASVGFDATVEPDRTEKPVSSDGPMFHSAAPGVGPTIARRTPSTEDAPEPDGEASTNGDAAADYQAASTNGEAADYQAASTNGEAAADHAASTNGEAAAHIEASATNGQVVPTTAVAESETTADANVTES